MSRGLATTGLVNTMPSAQNSTADCVYAPRIKQIPDTRCSSLTDDARLTEQDCLATQEPVPFRARAESQHLSDSGRPSLREEAYYGVVGDFVKSASPFTEADPASLLFTLLTVCGNAIGKRPHLLLGNAKHALKINTVVVGKTARARKGTALSCVLEAMKGADPDWSSTCIAQGLSSGEGIIERLRDRDEMSDYLAGAVESMESEEGNDNGEAPPESEIGLDIGVDGKRLMVVETEFASALRVMQRAGNTLGCIIRSAWDGEDLMNLKVNVRQATGTHISISGHITQDELSKELSSSDRNNGFANRFLWIYAERAQALSKGGNIPADLMQHLTGKLQVAIEAARTIGTITCDDEVDFGFDAVYRQFENSLPRSLESLTSRSEAYSKRIAALYAALDGESVIRSRHMIAALAAIEYAEWSVLHIFGKDGLPTKADRVYEYLMDFGPANRSAVNHSVLSGKAKAADLDAIRDTLATDGRIRYFTGTTSGRTAEIWEAIATPSISKPSVDYVRVYCDAVNLGGVKSEISWETPVDEGPYPPSIAFHADPTTMTAGEQEPGKTPADQNTPYVAFHADQAQMIADDQEPGRAPVDQDTPFVAFHAMVDPFGSEESVDAFFNDEHNGSSIGAVKATPVEVFRI